MSGQHRRRTPSQVCFEITESAVVANLDHARRFVGVLHGMGCQFALDDFGSGVGSFSNLKNLPMDYLKIDGSFIRNLARDSVNQAMVTAMIKLARTLNFKVIAEQVEDSSALDAARRMGVDFVQGYAIARPLPLPPARPDLQLLLRRLEFQRGAVHAVAQARGLRAVGEDVAEVSAAARAVDLGPLHQVSVVLARGHRAGDRLEEARPAGAAFEFRARTRRAADRSRRSEKRRRGARR